MTNTSPFVLSRIENNKSSYWHEDFDCYSRVITIWPVLPVYSYTFLNHDNGKYNLFYKMNLHIFDGEIYIS